MRKVGRKRKGSPWHEAGWGDTQGKRLPTGLAQTLTGTGPLGSPTLWFACVLAWAWWLLGPPPTSQRTYVQCLSRGLGPGMWHQMSPISVSPPPQPMADGWPLNILNLSARMCSYLDDGGWEACPCPGPGKSYLAWEWQDHAWPWDATGHVPDLNPTQAGARHLPKCREAAVTVWEWGRWGWLGLGQDNRELRACPRESILRRWDCAGARVSKPLVHWPIGLHFSKHKFKDKMIKNFKTALAACPTSQSHFGVQIFYSVSTTVMALSFRESSFFFVLT